MKKLLSLVVAFFIALNLNAQMGVDVGPKFGYQSSKLSFVKDDMNRNFRNDMNFGLFARFNFRKFSLQPELLYSYQNSNQKINNLSIPVLFGYRLVDYKYFKMRANVGPVAYFTLGDMSDITKKINMGGALGLGMDVWRLTFDINYSVGLTKVFKNGLLGIPEVSKARQNLFVVTIGFKLKY